MNPARNATTITRRARGMWRGCDPTTVDLDSLTFDEESDSSGATAADGGGAIEACSAGVECAPVGAVAAHLLQEAAGGGRDRDRDRDSTWDQQFARGIRELWVWKPALSGVAAGFKLGLEVEALGGGGASAIEVDDAAPEEQDQLAAAVCAAKSCVHWLKRSFRTIRHAEVVHRGYVLRHPLPPISRIELNAVARIARKSFAAPTTAGGPSPRRVACLASLHALRDRQQLADATTSLTMRLQSLLAAVLARWEVARSAFVASRVVVVLATGEPWTPPDVPPAPASSGAAHGLALSEDSPIPAAVLRLTLAALRTAVSRAVDLAAHVVAALSALWSLRALVAVDCASSWCCPDHFTALLSALQPTPHGVSIRSLTHQTLALFHTEASAAHRDTLPSPDAAPGVAQAALPFVRHHASAVVSEVATAREGLDTVSERGSNLQRKIQAARFLTRGQAAGETKQGNGSGVPLGAAAAVAWDEVATLCGGWADQAELLATRLLNQAAAVRAAGTALKERSADAVAEYNRAQNALRRTADRSAKSESLTAAGEDMDGAEAAVHGEFVAAATLNTHELAAAAAAEPTQHPSATQVFVEANPPTALSLARDLNAEPADDRLSWDTMRQGRSVLAELSARVQARGKAADGEGVMRHAVVLQSEEFVKSHDDTPSGHELHSVMLELSGVLRARFGGDTVFNGGGT